MLRPQGWGLGFRVSGPSQRDLDAGDTFRFPLAVSASGGVYVLKGQHICLLAEHGGEIRPVYEA